LLARTDANGSAYYHTDGNGNVTALVNGSGAVVAKYLYDSFGNALGLWGSLAAGNTYRFSSNDQDPRTGLYYYGYRWYDPNLQRWLNQDPIGERGGLNLYRFVNNDPVNKIDRLGLWGGGVIAGGSVNGGIGGNLQTGGGATGSVGAGYLFNGLDFANGEQGLFASGGAFMTGSGPGEINQVPSYTDSGQIPWNLGLYGGVGGGAWITNAKKFCDLNGPFKQWNLDTPIGSISYANSDGFWNLISGTWTLSVTAGPGAYGAISAFPTTTVTVSQPMANPSGPPSYQSSQSYRYGL
jgi:RHS repeat-associated protein